MRLIHISEYDEAKMELARPIYDNRGRILMAAGRSINSIILNKVMNMGISHLIIEDAESTGISLEEIIDIPTWMDAILTLKESYENIKLKKPFSLVSIQKIINRLIDEVKKSQTIFLIPTSFIGTELAEYAHAVNVTLLTLQIAKQFGYNEKSIHDVAIGALLHDIGKVVTNDGQKHPEEGFNILRNIREINLLSAHVALQHHESHDGTGYPRGIKGDKFIDYAQLCSIADSFENMIHIKGTSYHVAMKDIIKKKGANYKEEIVYAFANSIPSYLPGTIVYLNSGERAIVTKIKYNIHRPFVRILSSAREISLVDHPALMIITDALNAG